MTKISSGFVESHSAQFTGAIAPYSLDYGADGNVVGIDNASTKTELKELTLTKLPIQKQIVVA